MKALIDGSFKALRTGDYVTADTAAEEFIFDSENCELPLATLMEIASANKIAVRKDKKEKVVAVVLAGIVALELPTANERPESDIVAEIVSNGMAEGHSDEVMIVKIMEAGIKFAKAGKLFTFAMQSGGFRISQKDMATNIQKMLIDAEFTPGSYADVQAMVVQIVKDNSQIDSAYAMRAIKKYAATVKAELPARPKKPSGGFRALVHALVVDNPDISKGDFLSFCTKNNKKQKTADNMWVTIEFVQSAVKAERLRVAE